LKNLYVISGCNGAGKTTVSYTILPDILDCREFVNADEIARGLSPFQPETVAIEAGKIMLHRIDELLRENVNFAFETTLATKSYRQTILRAKAQGYSVVLLFFWLQSVELAKERVKKRVLAGGHNIDENVIERRYVNGIRNLFNIYFPVVDQIFIYDNSEGKQELIAKKSSDTDFSILNEKKYKQLKSKSL
jgi:predicted ABC-type ATPase